MSRQRRLRYRDALGNLPRRHRPLPQQLEDPATGGIGKRFEDQIHIFMFSETWKFGKSNSGDASFAGDRARRR
jgi:hypothetical protein